MGTLTPMSFVNLASVLGSNYALVIAFGILFLETALPLIIGLPGDTLLLTGGVIAAGASKDVTVHHFNVTELAIGAFFAAAIGSQIGHYLGWTFGVKVFNKPESKIFSAEKLLVAEKYVTKYGRGKAIILGRFVPVVRGLINPACGMIKIPFKVFAYWNVIGAIIWTQSLVWIGFAAGKTFASFIQNNLTKIVLLVAVLTILPLAWEIFKEWRSRKHLL